MWLKEKNDAAGQTNAPKRRTVASLACDWKQATFCNGLDFQSTHRKQTFFVAKRRCTTSASTCLCLRSVHPTTNVCPAPAFCVASASPKKCPSQVDTKSVHLFVSLHCAPQGRQENHPGHREATRPTRYFSGLAPHLGARTSPTEVCLTHGPYVCNHERVGSVSCPRTASKFVPSQVAREAPP